MMRLTKLVPSPIKNHLRAMYRDSDAWYALLPLKHTGVMTDEEVEAFCAGWGNRGFSADVDYCRQLLRLLGNGPVLECGTGSTTLLSAAVGARKGFETYSLEQDSRWAKAMRRSVRRTGSRNVTVIDAPLRDHGGYCWYDLRAKVPQHFSLILCDGPYIDKSLGEPFYSNWRYGLLPWAKGAGMTFDAILLDDVNDPRGPALLKRWEREFGVRTERIKSASGECAIVSTAVGGSRLDRFVR